MDLIAGRFHAEPAMAFLAERPLLARCALMGVIGVLVHHLVFIKNEWHMQGPRIIKSAIAAYVVLCFLEARKTLDVSAFGHAGLILGSFVLSLLLSIAAYRLFAHRTRHFPGPRLAGLTKLWHMYQCRHGQNHLVLERMHREYGDFVRTGPSEITIFHPNVLALLDGPRSKTSKSVWYDFLLPNSGVTTIRDRGWHDQRRRLWIKGFSNSAMERYREQIEAHARDMDAIIAAANGRPVPISTYIYWFSFDIMGIFAFSRSFNMLTTEKWHYSIRNLRRAMTLLGPFSSVPWAAQIGFWLLKGYWVVHDWHTMIDWCAQQMQLRIHEPDSHDVAQGIIADSRKRNTVKEDQQQLVGDAIVAIVAGSDTVAPTLVFAIYQLALNPDKAEKLYHEVKDVDLSDLATLKKLPYLNAVIMETLRLHPAVPTGGYRDTPPEGMMVEGTFIPGNTTIVAPRYVLGRLESCFIRPTEWIPERFDTQPELVKDTRSFLPFAQGRYSCLGKDVAMIELWVTISLLVSKYRFDFPAGKREETIERVEGRMRDQFTATPGDLSLVFTKREVASSQ
ncbi:uncharacterized protein N7482_002059 [Penicillium canariense]|uniref:Cytochrome P450 n=1 Tax=Penicillium canariense TaxID=189055 RepID=A0A9W9IGU8_9EURO|nr:uncharacterized protein N7482_002059 [Penicillium canariense]KAJ5176182.1 hypothetical protein N7482_002059 [Penicillium canariense]